MPDIKEWKNMKRIGIAAAILIVALLMTGAVSALASNEKTEKTIMIRGIGPDTAMTSDGQVVKVIFHNINNGTQIGTNQLQSTLSSVSGSVAPGYMDVWGPYSWTAGTYVSESATWTPTNQNALLGIYDLDQNNGPFLQRSGGSGTFSVSVPWTGSSWGYAFLNPASNSQTESYTLTY
ncbi:hypothetical protein [Methanoregula sp.]|uniref:hypothetical protein n=1 Tax=Methanoregula sp. TaxID=2052170 RepID=UPI0023761CBC|nr:hypothetical protein [Methanoregula sp.]MDD1686284.1 hypothetical protein [Methanoregula sp.]